ncbi:B-lymphocyte antigen CD20 isoform 3-T5 [Trichechus inunguis]|uniref:B-lymphocyte antigen CD20 isoform X4 n=1 Tax=Trichechus manatus latirostris TaxID=127582 RepID=A0A2Y9RZI6_TRIMA|nr:B-lymphocyte antigen CD20 isoform X4 [Trichechus manatus latirostris]
MTTPRNSLSRALPAEPMKGPIDMYPVQKINPQRMLSVVGPAQHFFMRESKALGAVQIMNGLFHFALGGLLMIPIGIYAPICVTVWYPLWGGTMFIISGSLLVAAEKNPRNSLVKGKMIMNSLSLFAAISGIILLIMDIFNITLSHFFKMESLQFIKGTKPYVNIYSCESDKNSEGSSLATQYCHGIRSVFLNVVLLSAEEKQEQTTEIKEHVIELTEISSQSKNEEEIEIIPVQEEEEEEAEINFPEPPQDQESSPIENDSAP